MTTYYCEQCSEEPADTILDGDALCETCARAQYRRAVQREWRAVTAAQLYQRWELR